MKKNWLFWAAFIVFFTAFSQIHATEDNTLFVPAVMVNDDCLYRDRIGGAWWSPPEVSDLYFACGGWWYHYESEVVEPDFSQYVSSGGRPVIWCFYDSRTGVDFVEFAQDLAIWADGDPIKVKLLNEPDRVGQCDISPEDTARALYEFQQLVPSGLMTWPNISHNGINHLRLSIQAYLNQYGVLPNPYRFGVHFYTSGPGTAAAYINSVCGVLAEFGLPCELDLMEFGSCVPEEMTSELTYLVGDSRVKDIGIFSNRYQGCVDLYDDAGFTAVGNAYIGVVR